jgi:hypothetical protein
VPRSRLPKNSQVRGDSQITGTTNLLSTSYPHAINPANGWFLALKDTIHHAIEQVHVFTIFRWLVGIILGIFFGITAGAERPSANSGKDNGNNIPLHLGSVKASDYPLYHFSDVGVQLVGIIEDNPSAI